MVIYFSGTGNSKYCAQKLSVRLDDELLDCAGYIKHSIAADLISGKPWVFVSPVYAWQIPHAFADFIRTGCFAGSRKAYFVMTCGDDAGAASRELKALCDYVGLEYMGAIEIAMPENYIAMFNVPDEEKSRKIVENAMPKLKDAAERIANGERFEEKNCSFTDKLKSGFINRGFYEFYVNAKAFYSKDSCIGCGKCEELCPLGNIMLKEGRPVWGERCTHCMACICNCPSEAIEYGKKSVGKRRYRCPDDVM